MKITINGETITTQQTILNNVLGENNFSKETKGIAVALNDKVITKSEWENVSVNENDNIEVVKPFQGG